MRECTKHFTTAVGDHTGPQLPLLGIILAPNYRYWGSYWPPTTAIGDHTGPQLPLLGIILAPNYRYWGSYWPPTTAIGDHTGPQLPLLGIILAPNYRYWGSYWSPFSGSCSCFQYCTACKGKLDPGLGMRLVCLPLDICRRRYNNYSSCCVHS